MKIPNDGSDRSEVIFYHVGEVSEAMKREPKHVSISDPRGMMATGYPLNGGEKVSILVDDFTMVHGVVFSVKGRVIENGYTTRKTEILCISALPHVPRKTGFVLTEADGVKEWKGLAGFLGEMEPGDVMEVPASLFALSSFGPVASTVGRAVGIRFRMEIRGGTAVVTAERREAEASGSGFGTTVSELKVGESAKITVKINSARTIAARIGAETGKKFSVSSNSNRVTRTA